MTVSGNSKSVLPQSIFKITLTATKNVGFSTGSTARNTFATFSGTHPSGIVNGTNGLGQQGSVYYKITKIA